MSSQTKQKPGKTETGFWDQRRGKIFSRKGGWIIGEAVHNSGYSLLDDLVGQVSYFQILLLNATGRMPEPRLAKWSEAVYSCMSWPDHRIWCNQIGSLAGTMGCSCLAAVSAGILATDSRMYGVGPFIDSVSFIRTARSWQREGLSVEEIISRHHAQKSGTPSISGYIRPVAKGDERVLVMKRITEELGFKSGEHLQLAYDIEQCLIASFGECMNINGFCASFLLDQGFTLNEIYRISSTVVHAGIVSCYSETADSPPLSFYPLQCEDIDYQGAPPRSLPTSTG